MSVRITVLDHPIKNLTDRQKFRVATHVHTPDGVCVKRPVGEDCISDTPPVLTETEAAQAMDFLDKGESLGRMLGHAVPRLLMLGGLIRAARQDRPATAVAYATGLILYAMPLAGKTGPVGPVGPMGATGATGPQGPIAADVNPFANAGRRGW